MTTPNDDNDDNAPVDMLDDSAGIDAIMQAIRDRIASLPPEEGRQWADQLLNLLVRDVIVPTPGHEEDEEQD
jgi:hypothetical protein